MMKNRAGLVALLVLAIAAVVMVFFVLPNREAAKNVAETAVKAVEEAKDTAESVADKVTAKAERVKDVAADAGVMEKVERLRSDAEAAAASLQNLFAGGRIPSGAELAEAKAKTEAALKAIAEFETPDGVEAALGNVVSGMKDKAAQALKLVETMPEDAATAASAVAGLKDLLGPAPGAETASSENESSESASEATVTDEASAQSAAAASIPTFDILRVEKDGSTVIAGKGEAGTTVELVDGNNVLASQVIGGAGDFAIVLDTPLSPGDHQLVLRTTNTNGEATVSEEVATVSVPETSNGELLAMVSKPGEASRILTMPETVDTPASDEVASQQTAEVTAQTEASEATEETADAAKKTSEAETSAAEEVAPSEQTQVPANAEVRVTAVELEGDKIFVAGNAKPGASVKVYAGDKLVDDATADANGHFVAEGELQLAVGNHIIRADVVEPDTGKVIVRASVPFNRPEGERVAVAAKTDGASANASAVGDSGVAEQLTQLREEVAKALVLLKGLFVDGQTPAPDALAAARSATQIALNALSAFKPGPESGQDLLDAAAKASASAEAALKVLQGAGESPSDVAGIIADLEAAASDATSPVTGNVVEEVAVEESANSPEPQTVSDTENAQAATDEVAVESNSSEGTTAAADTTEPKTIQQSPLEASDNSVIIRRGDTLWQISRRLYGKGVRYTTIYLANQQKIGDPNVIEPGQVFKVPEEMLQDDKEAEETNKQLQSQ